MGKNERKDKPLIILFDIETLPNLKEALRIWPSLSNYPGLTLKAAINSIICFGYKVLDEKTKCLCAWDYKSWKKDVNNDYEIVRDIYFILKDADTVVTHNGKSFDWKFIQTRLIKHGFPPLDKINHVDTKNLAKSNLSFFNNKLNTISKFLKLGTKLEHEGWELWENVHNKVKSSMAKMKKYCIQDVDLLEKVFIKLRPFAKVTNFNLYKMEGEDELCPNCGSKSLSSDGWRHTATMSFRRRVCRDCGTRCRTNVKGNTPRCY